MHLGLAVALCLLAGTSLPTARKGFITKLRETPR